MKKNLNQKPKINRKWNRKEKEREERNFKKNERWKNCLLKILKITRKECFFLIF